MSRLIKVERVGTYFAESIILVMHDMPLYDYFTIKPEKGRIPVHRTDVGLVILADLIGSKRVIFIKDEDVLYTDDPQKNPRCGIHTRNQREGTHEKESERSWN